MTRFQRNAFFGFFSLALILFAFEPLRRLAALSMNLENKHLSYILLIPFISAVLMYENRQKIFSEIGSSVLPAVGAFVAGGILYYVGRTYGVRLNENDYLVLTTAAVIVFWFGGFLLIYGSAAFKAGLFPLLFLGFAVPIPSRLLEGTVHFLQQGSADLVSVLFTMTGTPAYRNDMVFTLPGVVIEVAEACSGIRSTIGMFIVTLLATHMFLRSNWKRTALMIAVIPVSLFKNAVRIVTLTLLAVHFDMRFLTGSLHSDGGILFMVGGLCLMYPLLLWLIRSEEKMNFERGVQS